MGKTWVLDTETKGTGANMVPLEKVQKKPASEEKTARPRKAPTEARPTPAERKPSRPKRAPTEKTSTALPAGHVRKQATGEIGRVEAVDAKAGTARVRWLKRGASSTVRLSEISRR
ncbi:MAG: hypothetical protein ABW228_08330 [Thermoleophilaceae bacterium]